MKLFHNQAAGELPAPLARVYHTNIVPITSAIGGNRCGRCGNDYDQHLWLIVDPDEPEQGGVIDCGVAA